MTRASDDWATRLERARDHLHSAGEVPNRSGGPREEILASWRRSHDEGASAAEISAPYDENLNLSTKLVRAGNPVIQRIHEDVLDSPITVILADSRGKVLLRLSGEHHLEATLDRVLLAPGFNYAEKYMGTNGIGTALEGRTASLVVGGEHYNEALRPYACVGVPLRDPITNRILGVLDITTWAGMANPALTALVRQAGSVIEEGLLELSGHGAKALMEEYLQASRRGTQIVAVSGEALFATPAASSLLEDLGRDDLWSLAKDALTSKTGNAVPLLLPNGSEATLRVRSVVSDSQLVGAVIEVGQPETQQPTRLPSRRIIPVADFFGLSPATMGAALLVGRHAEQRLPVCAVGEPGVGKKTTIRAVASQHFPGRSLVVVDAAQTPLDVPEMITGVVADLSNGAPVLLDHADMLAEGVLANLMSTLARQEAPSGWLAFSLRTHSADGDDRAVNEFTAAGISLVAVPPLRTRIQDLEKIVPVMVRRHAGGRSLTLTPALVSRLARLQWSGNLTEVDGVVRQMVSHARGKVLDVPDLPRSSGEGLRRRLTPMEWMTREAIIAALRDNDGNKEKAADALGLSRASIYRKIKSLEIDVEAVPPT